MGAKEIRNIRLVEEIEGQRLIKILGVYIDYLFQTYFLPIIDMKRKDQNKHLEFTVNIKAARAYFVPHIKYPMLSN